MVKVIITESLFLQIQKRFSRGEALEIIDLLQSVEVSPQKGKIVGQVGGVIIKELKYLKFRFYFITDGYMLKYGTEDELAALLIKFVRMSQKKDQQEIINNIKSVLRSIGFDNFT